MHAGLAERKEKWRFARARPERWGVCPPGSKSGMLLLRSWPVLARGRLGRVGICSGRPVRGTRVVLSFGFMEVDGLTLACRGPSLQGIAPEQITYYFRRVMVIPSGKALGMAVWRKGAFCGDASACQFSRRLLRGADGPGRRGWSRGRD